MQVPTPQSLYQWRRLRGLTLRQLAAKTGLSAATLNRLERGDDPRVSQLRSIAKAVGLKAWWKLCP